MLEHIEGNDSIEPLPMIAGNPLEIRIDQRDTAFSCRIEQHRIDFRPRDARAAICRPLDKIA